MNMRLVRIPNSRPIASEEKASTRKLNIIVNGVVAPNSSFYREDTVLNNIILTISLKTPSP